MESHTFLQFVYIMQVIQLKFHTGVTQRRSVLPQSPPRTACNDVGMLCRHPGLTT